MLTIRKTQMTLGAVLGLITLGAVLSAQQPAKPPSKAPAKEKAAKQRPVAQNESAKSEKLTAKKLVGVYSIVSSENGGTKTPEERNRGVQVRFTEEAIVATDPKQKDVYAATYKLDASKSPAEIMMISTLEGSRGTIATGLIEASGDSVRLIYTLPGGNKKPTGFQAKEGEVMVVLKKQPGEEKKENKPE